MSLFAQHYTLALQEILYVVDRWSDYGPAELLTVSWLSLSYV